MRVGQTEIYDILRDGQIFRSFSTLSKALDYLAAARELQPDHEFVLSPVKAQIFER